jgi:hypothetical protein
MSAGAGRHQARPAGASASTSDSRRPPPPPSSAQPPSAQPTSAPPRAPPTVGVDSRKLLRFSRCLARNDVFFRRELPRAAGATALAGAAGGPARAPEVDAPSEGAKLTCLSMSLGDGPARGGRGRAASLAADESDESGAGAGLRAADCCAIGAARGML